MTGIRSEIEARAMTRFQMFVIGVMTFLNALDGFDVLAMTFAGTVLKPEWNITAVTLGGLISAGLAGMMAGSLFIAPFADKYGRRNLILFSLVLVTIGMFTSALTTNVFQMSVCRVITGLGIGAMLAGITSFTAEYANARRRSLCIAIMAIGYPLGGTLGGLAAFQLVSITGHWQPIFIFGGLCSLIFIPVFWFYIPDSFAYLSTRRPEGALEKINKLLPRMGLETISALPEAIETKGNEKGIYRVLRDNHLASTIKITLSYFLFAWTLYFALGWLPGILTEAGFSPAQGISGSVFMNAGGVVGGIVFGAIAGRWGGLRTTIPLFMLLCFVVFVVFGLAPTTLWILTALGALLGFCLIGIVSGLYATYPIIFPASVRTTGAGIVIGVGRIGGILSPIVAGRMLDAEMSRAMLCIGMALPLLIAMVLLRSIPELKRAG